MINNKIYTEMEFPDSSRGKTHFINNQIIKYFILRTWQTMRSIFHKYIVMKLYYYYHYYYYFIIIKIN